MESKTDFLFLIILIVVVSAFIGLNIVSIVDKKLKNISINMPNVTVPPSEVTINIENEEENFRIKCVNKDKVIKKKNKKPLIDNSKIKKPLNKKPLIDKSKTKKINKKNKKLKKRPTNESNKIKNSIIELNEYMAFNANEYE